MFSNNHSQRPNSFVTLHLLHNIRHIQRRPIIPLLRGADGTKSSLPRHNPPDSKGRFAFCFMTSSRRYTILGGKGEMNMKTFFVCYFSSSTSTLLSQTSIFLILHLRVASFSFLLYTMLLLFDTFVRADWQALHSTFTPFLACPPFVYSRIIGMNKKGISFRSTTLRHFMCVTMTRESIRVHV